MNKKTLELPKPGLARKLITKKKQLIIDNDVLRQQMYAQNKELVVTNNMLSLLQAIDTMVLDSRDELDVLCTNISKAIINYSSYSFVAILAKPPHHEFLELFGWSTAFGLKPELGSFKLHQDNYDKWLLGPEQKIGIDMSAVTDEALAHVLHKPKSQIAELRESLPLKSIMVVKLMAQTRLVGLMVVGIDRGLSELGDKDKLLLDRISSTVGIALDNRLLLEENRLVLRQLQKSNEKLKALDETKDEFISMASHQLRTPLTSVKGYVSMVMEGDAGKITGQQHKLLDQAFISSQRMVYLIADLLNVSRLRTGKFVIEPMPTNLADVIEGEISQLKDTARSRNLTLTYDKPKDFPTLMLDETKIRQVIMNFIDNAIYYTPAGGHINVALKDTGKTIEYIVTDDGIGVPKAEQHHMFSKFYRAGNAKKARPDGTGLGLFMAKKVIIAQDGSVIFKSEQGKGSTFGFSFAKSKLQVPIDKKQEGEDKS